MCGFKSHLRYQKKTAIRLSFFVPTVGLEREPAATGGGRRQARQRDSKALALRSKSRKTLYSRMAVFFVPTVGLEREPAATGGGRRQARRRDSKATALRSKSALVPKIKTKKKLSKKTLRFKFTLRVGSKQLSYCISSGSFSTIESFIS